MDVVTEVPAENIGRPDVGIAIRKLLTGHIELKAPGKGANPERLKGRDKEQWEHFKDLPNLIYTDGNEWALFRSGERVGKTIRFSGDVTTDGASAVEQSNADALFAMLEDFLQWQPIVPSSPRSLAKLLAPICRLLHRDCTQCLARPQFQFE